MMENIRVFGKITPARDQGARNRNDVFRRLCFFLGLEARMTRRGEYAAGNVLKRTRPRRTQPQRRISTPVLFSGFRSEKDKARRVRRRERT